VLEAALGFTCDFAKPGGFIGKEAIEKEKATPGNAKRRLMQVWHNSNRRIILCLPYRN
jgi:glycine cleavage system aminomethyltransferase T